MSTKSSKQPASRKARRAADRRDRSDAARDERHARASAAGGSTTWITTRNITLGAIAAGVLFIAVLAINQLGSLGGGPSSGSFVNPGIEYPAGIQDGNALGAANAPVVMDVWGDFQCPICAQHSLNVEPSLVGSYVIPGKLRIVHHDIDILGGGTDESRLPAIGGVCAAQQGKYWDYAHWVFANQQGERQGGFRRERLLQIADAAGMTEPAFTTCLDSQAAADAFNATQAQGQQLGISSTPTMLLNGTRSSGLKSPSDWAALIDAELAKASAAPGASGPTSSASSPAASGSSAP